MKQKYTMEELEAEVLNHLTNEKIENSLTGDNTYTHFMIEGYDHFIEVFIEQYGDTEPTIKVSTTHKREYHKERTDANEGYKEANAREIKKLSTLFSYIEKYV